MVSWDGGDMTELPQPGDKVWVPFGRSWYHGALDHMTPDHVYAWVWIPLDNDILEDDEETLVVFQVKDFRYTPPPEAKAS